VTSDTDFEYPIVEIFHSIQGEGVHAGTSSIFIRFGRCNLRCEWCDTEFDEWTDMSISEICKVLEKWDCDRVVLTGGEPALQDLWPLRRILQKKGYQFAIETNGTIELEEGLVDWICVSPKDQIYPDVSIKQRKGDELKVVYVGQDLSMYDSLIPGFENLYLQPCYFESESIEWNGANFRTTMEKVLQNPEWILSLQTHKWMDVR